ncbi:NAD(P)-dependent oxidoreductase [Candidatus Poribacteria bacterium]|nr:NAD(P)-dependent oxidoreductase [Candidatus Poribacteria bacterium]MBT5709713.1 NAD(P)-dependent oxidoreductase [Candidatus Poribacteria bacterium]MBT7805831.1 NAD(P)-dependent oxidoreductase [Candidatus Poribacteria bacterium]
MRVLVTGDRGRVGSVVVADLVAAGHDVVGYDRVDGHDALDPQALLAAADGCQGVIHLAHGYSGPESTPHGVMEVNLQGAWNVLCAAEEAVVSRVVAISSVNALGVFMGEAAPDYLPIDDDHPCYPGRAYGISKRLSEDMCRLWSAKTGIPVVCLRPPAVWAPDRYAKIQEARRERPEFEWKPIWEYGAFIDVRDLSAAILCALLKPFDGVGCLLVGSSDITTSGRTSREMAELVHPDVPWRGGEEYNDDPYRALVSIDNARRALGWEPQHTWRAVTGTDGAS